MRYSVYSIKEILFMEKRDVSIIINQLRAKLNLTQEDLAAKLGVAFSTLNRWENGKSFPQGKAKRQFWH